MNQERTEPEAGQPDAAGGEGRFKKHVEDQRQMRHEARSMIADEEARRAREQFEEAEAKAAAAKAKLAGVSGSQKPRPPEAPKRPKPGAAKPESNAPKANAPKPSPAKPKSGATKRRPKSNSGDEDWSSDLDWAPDEEEAAAEIQADRSSAEKNRATELSKAENPEKLPPAEEAEAATEPEPTVGLDLPMPVSTAPRAITTADIVIDDPYADGLPTGAPAELGEVETEPKDEIEDEIEDEEEGGEEDEETGPDRYIGKTFAGLEIMGKLGEGGMGAVYKARHLNLDKIVALKLLPEEFQKDPDAVKRFKREARAAAKVEHPNIAQVYDFGQADETFYLIMQYVEGEPLTARLKDGFVLPLEQTIHIGREVAKGLARAHEAGLVHRDIKPANILISNRKEVLIVDFGLATQSTAQIDEKLTTPGAIIGTPQYMAPEQCEGILEVDARADIFSLGLILYAMVTGHVPAEGQSALHIMYNRIENDLRPPIESNPNIPPELNWLIMNMTARDRDQRIQMANEVVSCLNSIQPPETGGHTQLMKVPSGLYQAPFPTPSPAVPVSPGQAANLLATSASGVTVAAPVEEASPEDVNKKIVVIGGVALAGFAFVILFVVLIGIFAKSQPPVTISELAVPPWTQKDSLTIAGKASRGGDVTVTVNGNSKPSDADGAFQRTLKLLEGPNEVKVEVKDAEGRKEEKSFTVTLDSIKPRIDINGELNGAMAVAPGQLIKGKIIDKNLVEFLVDGQKQSWSAGGLFELKVEGGGKTLALKARDKAGNSIEKELKLLNLVKIVTSSVAPWTKIPKVTVSGQASRGPVSVSVGTKVVRSDPTGLFSVKVELREGVNELVLKVKTEDGSTAEAKLKSTLDSRKPVIVVAGYTGTGTLGLERDGILKGTVRDANLVEIAIDGAPVELDAAGGFHVKVGAPGAERKVVITARDRAGNSSRLELVAQVVPPVKILLIDKLPSWTRKAVVTISGRANRANITATIAGRSQVSPDGGFRGAVRLREGANVVTVVVKATDGTMDSRKLKISMDTKPPVIRCAGDQGNNQVNLSPDGHLKGVVSDRSALTFFHNRKQVKLKAAGSFDLNIGKANKIIELFLTAKDLAGNRTVRKLRVGLPAVFRRDLIEGTIGSAATWSKATTQLQDKCIAYIGKRLGATFRLLKTETYKCGGQGFRIAVFRHLKTKIDFNLLPGGTYKMGTEDRSVTAQPVHDVKLAPLLMARIELTQLQWDVVGGKDSRPRKGAALPISNVSWSSVKAWLSKAGDGFRLPSEAEWEYAARAQTTTDYFWGKTMDDRYCFYRKNSRKQYWPGRTHNVPNAFGLVDQSGNVAEWCEDDFIEGYASGPATEQARVGATRAKYRVVRGGSWFDYAKDCRVVARTKRLPGFEHATLGFRVAVSLP